MSGIVDTSERSKGALTGALTDDGFTLIELLIVVAIIMSEMIEKKAAAAVR